MSILELNCDEPVLKMGAKPAAVLFISPEGILLIQWVEGCSSEEQCRIEKTLERGMRFEDLK